LNAREWGQDHLGKIDHASEELSGEGYVIITPTRGVELTDKGYFYLFNEV
jgi:Mn-dependent DtxR family transcriptional regulator